MRDASKESPLPALSRQAGTFFGATDLEALPSSTLLMPRETASFLKVNENTLANWRATGRQNLPFIKIGGRVRYRVGDVLEWIACRTVSKTGEAA